MTSWACNLDVIAEAVRIHGERGADFDPTPSPTIAKTACLARGDSEGVQFESTGIPRCVWCPPL